MTLADNGDVIIRTVDECDKLINVLWTELHATVQEERSDMVPLEIMASIAILSSYYITVTAIGHGKPLHEARGLFNGMLDKLQALVTDRDGATVQ